MSTLNGIIPSGGTPSCCFSTATCEEPHMEQVVAVSFLSKITSAPHVEQVTQSCSSSDSSPLSRLEYPSKSCSITLSPMVLISPGTRQEAHSNCCLRMFHFIVPPQFGHTKFSVLTPASDICYSSSFIILFSLASSSSTEDDLKFSHAYFSSRSFFSLSAS